MPRADRVLLVFAHPDDESYGPGATIASLAQRGFEPTLITFTRGEQSTLGVDLVSGPAELAELRERELLLAAEELGIAEVRQHRYPDGALAEVARSELVSIVVDALHELQPRLVISFGRGGISGHADHIAAGEIALSAARIFADRAIDPLPVYGWAMPGHIAEVLGQRLNRTYPVDPDEDLVPVRVDDPALEAQWRAVQQHRSQHSPPPWPFAIRREVQAGYEFLSRLAPTPAPERDPLLTLLDQ